jgi:hypothetical protein
LINKKFNKWDREAGKLGGWEAMKLESSKVRKLESHQDSES